MYVIVNAVCAVGMRHHGSRSLQVGEAYTLHYDKGNRFDSNALAIKADDGRVKAYIKRDQAIHLLGPVISVRTRVCMLRPKAEPEFISKKVGFQQRCNVSFSMDERDAELLKATLETAGFSITLSKPGTKKQ